MGLYVSRFFYSLIFYLLLPVIFLRLYLRSRKAPAYRDRWGDRLALQARPRLEQSIWIHAVSVGEVLAAVPIIKQLREGFPHLPIMVTTMTPTGSDRVRAILGDQINHVYVPYDLPGALSRFYRRVNPRVLVIMETELWPNMIHYAKQQNIPVIVANARLSEKSMNGYARGGSLVRNMLQAIDHLAVQAQADAERFQYLGVPAGRVTVTGSVKFDMNVDDQVLQSAQSLKAQWQGRPCVVAASTHVGEDEWVLDAFARFKAEFANAFLILVPRHPERFDQVAALLAQRGFQYARRSTGGAVNADTQVLLGDTMGELVLLMATGDAVFVGGSLVKTGGHNVLEPIALGLPAVTGPHTFNFQTICDSLFAVNGLRQVENATELADVWREWIKQRPQQQIDNASRFLAENRGASARQFALISQYL